MADNQAEEDIRSLDEILELVSGDPNGAVNDVFLEIFRRIVKVVQELHAKNKCHGNLDGQNIFLELNMHASIQGGAVKRVMVTTPNSSDSITKADDIRALGNLLLLWYSDGVQRTSEDILQDEEVRYEARHVIGTMLQLENYPPCPTLHKLSKEPGLWYVSERVAFFKYMGDHVGNESHPEYNFLKDPIEEIKEDVLPPEALGVEGWASSFSKTLMDKVKKMARGQGISYDCHSVCDLLRFLRDILKHGYEIPEVELEFGGKSDPELEFALCCKFPRLLLGVYKAMDMAWEAKRNADPRSLTKCQPLSMYF